MNRYSPTIHTPEALATQIEALYVNHEDAVVVGSLGRSVLYGAVLSDADYEFRAREENPLVSSQIARDIDVLAMPQDAAPAAAQPFELDRDALGSPWVQFVKEGESWFLVSDKRRFAEPLHPAVMEPVEGKTVFDIACTTVNPKTHLHLLGLNGIYRPKDTLSVTLLKEAINAENAAIPDAFYEPFVALRQKNIGLMSFARHGYRVIVPESVRARLYPFMKTIKYKLPF